MTRCTTYKSYIFNCGWLLVDFPSVVNRAAEESGEINQRNNGTSQKKELYYCYIMQCA